MSKCECRDCIHYEVCEYKGDMLCDYFKDKSLFVELPCKVGGTVYCIRNNMVVEETIAYYYVEENNEISFVNDREDTDFTFGITAFTDREEAERKLREVGE